MAEYSEGEDDYEDMDHHMDDDASGLVAALEHGTHHGQLHLHSQHMLPPPEFSFPMHKDVIDQIEQQQMHLPQMHQMQQLPMMQSMHLDPLSMSQHMPQPHMQGQPPPPPPLVQQPMQSFASKHERASAGGSGRRQNLSRPVQYDSWPDPKKRAYEGYQTNPGMYYMHFVDPDEKPNNGKWTDEEKAFFIDCLAKHPPSKIGWGMFARFFRGRTGLQCRTLHQSLVKEHKLSDHLLSRKRTGDHSSETNLALAAAAAAATEHSRKRPKREDLSQMEPPLITNPAGEQLIVHAYAKLVGPTLEYYIQSYDVTLGRKTFHCQSADVDISSARSVSRIHARITFSFEQQQFLIYSLGQNGMLVDGRFYPRESHPAALKSRSCIEIGGLPIFFLLPHRPKEQPKRPDAPAPTFHHNVAASALPSSMTHQALPQHQMMPHQLSMHQSQTLPAMQTMHPLGAVTQLPQPGLSGTGVNPVMQNGEKATRPALSYTALIAEAIEGSPGRRAQLQNIYLSIMSKHPYYQSADPRWRVTIRQTLSSAKMFKKDTRGDDDGTTKSAYWTIDDSYDTAALLSSRTRKPLSPKHEPIGLPLPPHSEDDFHGFE
eukprot:TRINITY_DN18957_c0_g1_i1.p1 TRINITY_DN18957_c0_g1~~TRINITY_DN18957_c0_g1_i1.p1  ORF type:complete len:612 (-),score=144.32 TRINITY_DN18957_c0_g1_i1:20-1819(-)